jgi:hypothetical protein
MKEYLLNIDPCILELLGPNLYSNSHYVRTERIANAYDPDAKNVYIIGNEDDIRVADDGHGMSYDSPDIADILIENGYSTENRIEALLNDEFKLQRGIDGTTR